MNYRHDFHAGNFADVLKHAVLALVLRHLAAKPAPFRVIDSHAGAGLYRLDSAEAARTGEWRCGVGRLWDAPLPAAAEAVLAPWRRALAAVNPDGRLLAYPGSPCLATALARPQDRFTFVEREGEPRAALAARTAGDRRVTISDLDGWRALGAVVPPQERRGVVLIDPPFEEAGEFARLLDGLAGAHRRWPTGTYLLWYPLKDVRAADRFGRELAASGIADIVRTELRVAPVRADGPLGGCGLVAVNPPWTLERDLAVLLPALAERLGRDGGGRARLDRLAQETRGGAP